eukprot:7943046-Ditylum_brightwellii.AAC.1
MQNIIESVSHIKHLSKYYMDKECPPIDAMSIAPLNSSDDESAEFCTLDANCTTEEGPHFA